MRRTAVHILQQLQDRPYTVGQLADRLNKNQGWISELVTDLETQNLVDKNGAVELAGTYEAQLLRDLADTYDLETIFTGTKEDVLQALLDGPKTVADLELGGFATSTIYQALNDLQETGVVEETEDGYRLTSETLSKFLEARASTASDEYTADGETIHITSDEEGDGRLTAFSAFTRYGVDYYPSDSYRYEGSQELELEDILIHAVRVAETKKQMAMASVFYLTHSASLDNSELWRLARRWDCVEKWADILAFLDQRDVQREELFLPWEEFTDLARDYDVYPRGKHPEESLLAGLEDLGDTLDTEVDTYLLGGGNLILRGLKDSTKDLDVVVSDRHALRTLTGALQQMGYEERQDLDRVYENLNPSIILEKQGFPRWDIFVEVVADQLHLTEAMKQRANETREFGQLRLHLLSVTDIVLFKAITDREGDLEDVALIARQGEVDWQQLLDELQDQEERTDQYFSFAVLDTFDLLDDRYGIEVPIHQRLVSYCLEKALLVTLEEPKSIRDLRDELEFPDHQIYNKLRKLEEEGDIKVDRSGTLNRYVRTT